jgi:MFS family permease
VETIIPVYVDDTFNHAKNENGDPIIKLNTAQVSLIMVSLEISSLLIAPIVPIVSQKYGKKNVILFGYLIVVLSTCALSCTAFTKHPTVYMWTAIACRFMQGCGDQSVQIISYSILTSTFPSR